MSDARPQTDELPPWDEGWLDVGDGHRIWYEQWGALDGLPVVSLHGGPGSGYTDRHRRFFDPARYRVVLFDQRGCGRSEPRGLLEANTTAHLVADIERLRRHLGISDWLVFGGSWGACLALAYAFCHPAACRGLILRAPFLGERSDLRWFFQGARRLLPEAWEAFAAPAPADRRRDLLGWYAERLHEADEAAALAAVRSWMRWEAALSRPGTPAPPLPCVDTADGARLVGKYRLQSHYLLHACFMGTPHPLPGTLQCARKLRGVPAALLHGRLDLVCRPETSWRLHRSLQGSRIQFANDTGHDPFAPDMLRAIVALTDHFVEHGRFDGWGETRPATAPSHGFR